MKLSDAIAKLLIEYEVTHVFGYQGGSITHMIDSFDRYGINYIQSYNEQGASFAADSFSRIRCGELGVAIGTNGPGATNMITGIADAFCDSVPTLFFTGQVHSYAMKGDKKVRQESFQEIDILSIVKPITKHAVAILDKDSALDEIEKAIRIAKEGRPGPVVVDLPVDIQGQDVEYACKLKNKEIDYISNSNTLNTIDRVIDKLYSSQRPLIIAGGGIRTANSVELFRQFVKMIKCPVVFSLMGLDSLEVDREEYIGFIGTYGNRYANLSVQGADLIICIGSRLDLRQTGKRRDLFAKNAVLAHIDIDSNEIGHIKSDEIGINIDIKTFLKYAIKRINHKGELNIFEWKNKIACWKKNYPSGTEIEKCGGMNPNILVEKIAAEIPDNSVITCDVGQNQMWMAQSLRVKGKNVRILNSGGLGAMGFSLPASIGAYYANKESSVIAFMGDGGFQMNIQELQVISALKLPIVVVVFNNKSLGLIRDVHEKYYEERYVGSVEGFSMPNLKKLADAYEFQYEKISSYEEVNNFKSIIYERRAYIIEVLLGNKTYVKPELLGNDGLERQIPYKEV